MTKDTPSISSCSGKSVVFTIAGSIIWSAMSSEVSREGAIKKEISLLAAGSFSSEVNARF